MAAMPLGLLILGLLLGCLLWGLRRASADEQPSDHHGPTSPPSCAGPDGSRPVQRHWCALRHGSRTSPAGENLHSYRLNAKKAIRSFDFILRSLGQTAPWQSAKEKEDYIHDLTVMLAEGDLQTACLELLDADQSVLYRHEVHFGSADRQRRVDGAQGVELPLISPERIAGHRLLLSPVRRLADYRHELRRRWSYTRQLPEHPGSRFLSEHTQRIHGGRATGRVFVSDEARCTARVVHVSPAGDYAFATHPDLPLQVFLHKAYCEEPVEFAPGMKVSFIPIQTPRGLQGRNIRTA